MRTNNFTSGLSASLPISKSCTKCKEEKPLSAFGKNKIGRFGVNPACKACACKYAAEYAEKNKDLVAERKRAYRASPEGKLAALAYSKQYKELHAEELREKRITAYHATKDERREKKAETGKAYRARHREVISARRRAAYLLNPEAQARNIERSSEWYSANKEAAAEVQRTFYANNREAIKTRIALYQKANPEKTRLLYRIKTHRRRGRLLDAGGKFTRADVDRLLALQRHRCANCGACLKASYHIDHKQPVAKGGTNHPDNIELLCPPCNLRKSDKLPHLFAQENGRLI